MESPLSQDEIILNNCKDLLDRVISQDPHFVVEVSRRQEDITAHMSIVELGNISIRGTTSEFYKQLYELLRTIPSLCSVTADAIPPTVPVVQAPSSYQRLSVIRTTAWLIKIVNEGASGFFNKNKRPERMGGDNTHIAPESDMELSSTKRKEYLDSILESYPIDCVTEYKDMIDECLTPLPVWWTDKIDHSLERRFNAKYRELYGADFDY